MAEVFPLKEIPRSDGGCSIVEFTNDDYLGISALPNALPDDWDEFDIGHTFTSGDQVWYLGRLYSCDAQHNKTTTNNPDATGNWQFVGGNLTVLSGSAGQDPISNVTQLEFSLNINSGLSGSNISLQPNASGDRADYTFNLDPDDFVSTSGGLTSVSSDETLTGDGTSGNPLGAANFLQKFSLFFGTPGAATNITLDSIATSYTDYTTAGTPYYFIQGVELNGSGDGFVAGQGVWTESLPTGTIDFANTFNLIG